MATIERVFLLPGTWFSGRGLILTLAVSFDVTSGPFIPAQNQVGRQDRRAYFAGISHEAGHTGGHGRGREGIVEQGAVGEAERDIADGQGQVDSQLSLNAADGLDDLGPEAGSAPTAKVSTSMMISSRGMPAASARVTILWAMATRRSTLSGVRFVFG